MVRKVLEAFGRIDILVNNAGIQNEHPFLEMGLEDWEKGVSVNLTRAFPLNQEAIKVIHRLLGGRHEALSRCGPRFAEWSMSASARRRTGA